MAEVSILIVNYNGGAFLPRCLEAVSDQEGDWDCILVDNGSTDGSIAALPALDDRFTVIEAGENLGFAAANNLAARHATGDWLACLNPDAYPRPGWLRDLLAETHRPGVTMVGSVQIMADDPARLDGLGDNYDITGLAWRGAHDRPVADYLGSDGTLGPSFEVFGPCAAAALYHREAFERVGGFDEDFFCYHEDVDLAYRLRLIGGRAVQSTTATVDHVSSGISGRASEFAIFHGVRNRVYTFVKCTPAPLLIPLGVLHLGINTAYLLWALVRTGRVGATWRGFRAGLARIPMAFRARDNVERTVPVRQVFAALAKNPWSLTHRAVIRREL